MANEQNLIPLTERSESEQRAMRSKGGKNSGKTRRERKTMRDTLKIMLDMSLTNGKKLNIEKVKSFAGLKGENITMQEFLMMKMMKAAAEGNVRAMEYIRDTIGEKPTDRMSLSTTEEALADKLNEVFGNVEQ